MIEKVERENWIIIWVTFLGTLGGLVEIETEISR